jgi:hypothetical protein
VSSTAEADHTTVATIAADRARALRDHAASITTEALEPLRKALQIRAELAAAVLLEDAPPAAPKLRAIA